MSNLTAEEKSLIDATQIYAVDDPKRSTWYVLSTFSLLAILIVAVVITQLTWLKVTLSALTGLVLLRCFVLYHDFLHGSILRQSCWAGILFHVFSPLLLTPKSVWQETHNYHHAHTAKIATSHIGSYKMSTIDMWRKMSKHEKIVYKYLRHPLNMLLGVFTVFIFGICIAPFFRSPYKNWDALLVLLVYFTISISVSYLLGFTTYLYAILIPQIITSIVGSYLFYAQHNFPTVNLRPLKYWSYVHAALHSSSFMCMHPIMHWFTANIGYHHIHHLNPRIPFYRLPEVMRDIPELQPKHITSLSWNDIRACLSLKLWDSKQQKMVPYPN